MFKALFALPLAALLTIVCHFEPQAVRVIEERCPIVGRVFGMPLGLGRLDSQRAQLPGNGLNIRHGLDAKAQMMQARRIWVMSS